MEIKKQDKIWQGIFFIVIFFLQSCASSNVSRQANDNVAVGYQNASSTFGGAGNGSLADSYGNASQTTKGLLVGGVAGAVVGGATSGVGVVPGLATGAILGGAYGAYIDSNTSLVDRLENRGVKVMVLGDQVRLVLHSGHLFNGMTATIRPGAYQTLDLVAQYLNSFTTMSVRVTGYTNATGTPRIEQAVSKEQAESVVRYLWQRGVNTRMMTASGMGGNNLITRRSSDWEGSLNYRIEVTTEKLPTTGTLG
jgi:outer membrane protein OmpA-like peptidoglycan-associated protein